MSRLKGTPDAFFSSALLTTSWYWRIGQESLRSGLSDWECEIPAKLQAFEGEGSFCLPGRKLVAASRCWLSADASRFGPDVHPSRGDVHNEPLVSKPGCTNGAAIRLRVKLGGAA